MGFKPSGVLLAMLLFTVGCAQDGASNAASDGRAEELLQQLPESRAQQQRDGLVRFSFNAFGDSGWANTHVAKPAYQSGFRKAYQQFDPSKALIGDINYINWETSVGQVCSAFWSPSTASTYAFLTRPEELSDAVSMGFSLVGMANNHSFDCLRSPEGNGPLQTLSHVERLRAALQAEGRSALFSGVFRSPAAEAPEGLMKLRTGQLPVRFLSAYVGGDAEHCRNILCDQALERYASPMRDQVGLRVLALHSWDPSSHKRLQGILRSWLQRGLVDVAIGSGPHVAESVSVVRTPRGRGVLATSLGNFIHPSLSNQPNNIVLRTSWSYDPTVKRLALESVASTVASCDGERCRQGATRQYALPDSPR